MTSLHWQTSLQTQKGHALACLNGHGVDYWCSFTTGQMRLNTSVVFLACVKGDDFASFMEALHGASSNASWHCWIVCCFWEIHLELLGYFLFLFFSRKNPQAMQDPPGLIECSDGWHCQIPAATWDLAELISCSWRGCSLEGVGDTRVACSEDCMWSRHVSITF